MHATVAQNAAHRNDVQWIKTTGRSFEANGEHYLSEYLNPFTGQAIRKSWRMTGRDWFVFDADGQIVNQYPQYPTLGAGHATLTLAKYAAQAA